MSALLSVRDLHRSFGGVAATQGITFNLAAGAQEAIIGPNGAGKSTFFALLSGYHKPDRGVVTFDGADVTGMEPHRIVRAGMSRAFQVANIFGRMTVLENVRTAVQAQMQRTFDMFTPASGVGLEAAHKVLALCRLADREQVVASSLSQGDKKKLELALALAGRPKLLLLDEPTAGMSLEETHETMGVVDQLNRELGVSVLFTEHDMSVVFNHAQRITVLHRGKLVAQGTPDEIRNNAVAQEIYFGEKV